MYLKDIFVNMLSGRNGLEQICVRLELDSGFAQKSKFCTEIVLLKIKKEKSVRKG